MSSYVYSFLQTTASQKSNIDFLKKYNLIELVNPHTMNVSLCSVEQSTFKDVGPHAMFTQSFMKTDRVVSS